MGDSPRKPDQPSPTARARGRLLDKRLLWNLTTLLGILYLGAVGLGLIPGGRFGQTEAIVFVAILLLNPATVEAFVERVRSLSVSSTGFELRLQQVQRQQDEQAQVLETLAFLLASYLPRDE